MLAPFLVPLAALLAAGPAPPPVVAVVVGTAQDGGLPQINCRRENCTRARQDPSRRRQVASLALHDGATRETFLVDATPDLPAQLARLADDPVVALPPGRTPLAGILLTHAHTGHYLGLARFGRETLASRDLPVYASRRMTAFLAGNAPWSQLVELGNICLRTIEPDQRIPLTPRLAVTAMVVPHRDELSDTLAYLVHGPHRTLLWLPDIDRWERWDRDLGDVLRSVDIAFLDATFYSRDELPDRNLDEIPHPLVVETAARVRALEAPRPRVFLIHMNHSNPVVGDDPAIARELVDAGLEVAREGLRLEL